MKRFAKAVAELEPDQIAERDLEWLLSGAAVAALVDQMDDGRMNPNAVALLRGIARTCNKTALYYEQHLGMPRANPQGRKPNA